jgi:hypothetical protein
LTPVIKSIQEKQRQRLLLRKLNMSRHEEETNETSRDEKSIEVVPEPEEEADAADAEIAAEASGITGSKESSAKEEAGKVSAESDIKEEEGKAEESKEAEPSEDKEKSEKPEGDEKTEDKGKSEEKNPGPPASPSQGQIPYGSHAYPPYGHPMYAPPYGYPPPHYQPYYPGGYQYPPHMMHPPHMMPPHQGYGSSEQGSSPGRRYHSMPVYNPYPPASPLVGYGPGGPESSPSRTGSGTRPEDAQQGPDQERKDLDGNMNNAEINPEDIGAAASRVKVYVKPSGQASEEVLARRSRKNFQSRSRASKHREHIEMIEAKDASERTPEEQQLFETHQMRRKRKNDRSRERALEKKGEIDRILAKAEKERTRIEIQFLDNALGSKRRKNEGDRLRRSRLKELGLSPKGSIGKPGIPARGPLPSKYQELSVSRSKQIEQPHHVGQNGYMMPHPPHAYGAHAMMPPPHHHEHQPDGSNSPPAGMYQL